MQYTLYMHVHVCKYRHAWAYIICFSNCSLLLQGQTAASQSICMTLSTTLLHVCKYRHAWAYIICFSNCNLLLQGQTAASQSMCMTLSTTLLKEFRSKLTRATLPLLRAHRHQQEQFQCKQTHFTSLSVASLACN